MRPACKSCGRPGPTIDGRCIAHMSIATEGDLYTVDAETVLELELELEGAR